MSNAVEVEFECCSTTYTIPTTLRDDQTLLANAALADTLLMLAEATHAQEHPECPQDES